MRNRWLALGGLTTALLGSLWPLLSAAQPAPSRPEPVVSHNIPIDVDVPFASPEQNQPFFDDFSWREFIALTWPARLGSRAPYPRGSPDTDRKYGDVSVPTVWETWKADVELLLPGGAAPSDWRSFASPSPCDATASLVPYQKVLGSFDTYHGLNQAFSGPLVSQNRQYIRYETRVNRAAYQFLLEPGGAYPGPLYLAKNLPGNGAAPALRFPSGSVTVKASWRVLTGVPEAQRQRYYVTRANVLEPLTGRCTVTDVGLLGLHIVNKTPTFPRWVWSSFEHVDNVPEPGGEASQGQPPYALNGQRPATPPSPRSEPLGRCNPPQRDPAPTQVVRTRPLADSTRRTNDAYHRAEGVKGTVWENYQLVVTQWPLGDGADDGAFPGTSSSTNTANVSLETWFQDSADASCMACHGRANARQHDSVWFLPLGAQPGKPETCPR